MTLLRTLLSLTFLLSISFLRANAQRFTAEEAKDHIGEKAVVCGKVANEHTAASSRGTPTFIDLDSAYPNRVFTVVVWGNDKPGVGNLPSVGTRVCVTGLIETYRGVPRIEVWTREQFSH